MPEGFLQGILVMVIVFFFPNGLAGSLHFSLPLPPDRGLSTRSSGGFSRKILAYELGRLYFSLSSEDSFVVPLLRGLFFCDVPGEPQGQKSPKK